MGVFLGQSRCTRRAATVDGQSCRDTGRRKLQLPQFTGSCPRWGRRVTLHAFQLGRDRAPPLGLCGKAVYCHSKDPAVAAYGEQRHQGRVLPCALHVRAFRPAYWGVCVGALCGEYGGVVGGKKDVFALDNPHVGCNMSVCGC